MKSALEATIKSTTTSAKIRSRLRRGRFGCFTGVSVTVPPRLLQRTTRFAGLPPVSSPCVKPLTATPAQTFIRPLFRRVVAGDSSVFRVFGITKGVVQKLNFLLKRLLGRLRLQDGIREDCQANTIRRNRNSDVPRIDSKRFTIFSC